MNLIEIKKEFNDILSDKYGWSTEEIIEVDDFEELGLDSLSLYSLVSEAEDYYNIKIDTDDITEINTPSKFIEYIDKKVNHEK